VNRRLVVRASGTAESFPTLEPDGETPAVSSLNHGGEDWQFGYIIAKGGIEDTRRRRLSVFRAEIARFALLPAGRVASWHLGRHGALTVRVDRVLTQHTHVLNQASRRAKPGRQHGSVTAPGIYRIAPRVAPYILGLRSRSDHTCPKPPSPFRPRASAEGASARSRAALPCATRSFCPATWFQDTYSSVAQQQRKP
jgi:hypothetical protein